MALAAIGRRRARPASGTTSSHCRPMERQLKATSATEGMRAVVAVAVAASSAAGNAATSVRSTECLGIPAAVRTCCSIPATAASPPMKLCVLEAARACRRVWTRACAVDCTRVRSRVTAVSSAPAATPVGSTAHPPSAWSARATPDRRRSRIAVAAGHRSPPSLVGMRPTQPRVPTASCT